jgi:hypothetical protein
MPMGTHDGNGDAMNIVFPTPLAGYDEPPKIELSNCY